MPRESIVLVRKHGSPFKEILKGPEVPYAEQRQAFKEIKANRTHPEYDHVEFCWLDVESKRRLDKPVDTKAEAEAQAEKARLEVEAEAKRLAEEQAKQEAEAKAKAEAEAVKPIRKKAGN